MSKIKAAFRPILFGILIIVTILFLTVLGSTLNFSDLATYLTIQLGLIIVTLLLIPTVKKEYGIDIKEHIDYKSLSFRSIFSLIILTIAIELLFIQLEGIAMLRTGEATSSSAPRAMSVLIASYLFGICVAPIIEEIVCRVIMIESCKTEIGAVFSIILTSLIFSLIHLRGLFPTVHIFITALLLGYVYIKTNNAAYTMIMHCTTNLLLIILDLLYWFGLPVYKVINGVTVINGYLLAATIIAAITTSVSYKMIKKGNRKSVE